MFRFISDYLYNIGLGLSITLSAMVGGKRWQTLSSLAYVWTSKGYSALERAIDFVAKYVFKDYNHCAGSHVVYLQIKTALGLKK